MKTANLIERLRHGVDTNEPPDKTDNLMAEAADEIERLHRMLDALHAIRDAAAMLVDECEGGSLPPSLGALARVESALHSEWSKARREGRAG